MGYSTDFQGELKFIEEATAAQLAKLKTIFNEDCRDHPEWNNPNLYYVDLEFTDDFSGVKWNGAEKTYGMVEIVNMILDVMRKDWPEFGFTGELLAQGEDYDDRWKLKIKDGRAIKVDMPRTGDRITCPHCEREFTLED